jgi:hypothetical protein
MIDYDDVVSIDGGPDERGPRAVIKLGLVTAERPKHGSTLDPEVLCYQETKDVPIIFEEEDAEGRPVFANAREFADKMGLAPGILPTEAQALARGSKEVTARRPRSFATAARGQLKFWPGYFPLDPDDVGGGRMDGVISPELARRGIRVHPPGGPRVVWWIPRRDRPARKAPI